MTNIDIEGIIRATIEAWNDESHAAWQGPHGGYDDDVDHFVSRLPEVDAGILDALAPIRELIRAVDDMVDTMRDLLPGGVPSLSERVFSAFTFSEMESLAAVVKQSDPDLATAVIRAWVASDPDAACDPDDNIRPELAGWGVELSDQHTRIIISAPGVDDVIAIIWDHHQSEPDWTTTELLRADETPGPVDPLDGNPYDLSESEKHDDVQ